MRASTKCNVVCRKTLDEKTAKEFKEKIDDEYRAEMMLDHIPLVAPITSNDSPPIYQLGYFVGRKERHTSSEEEKYFINNHLSFTVKYHQNAETSAARIVAFEVKAFSINHKYDGPWGGLITCDTHGKRLATTSDPPQEVDDKKDIIFSYDVEFQESDVKWSSRLDTYHVLTDDQTPWFPIVNSLMNVLLVSVMVAVAMLATLHRCISKYNELDILEAEAQEETNWRLIHTDVFRPPVNSELLCVFVGSGVQLFCMIAITVTFGVLGFFSRLNDSGLVVVLLLFWSIMGIFGGFAMSSLYKTFGGTEWIKTTLKTACMFPGLVACILFLLNTLIWGHKSWEGHVPFRNMFVSLFLGLWVFIPLVFIGSYFGFKKPGTNYPVKPNEIPTEMRQQNWYMKPFVSIMIGGIIPFGAVFNELFFILTSTGSRHFYYILGLVFVVLIVICAEVTILLCYYQLCGEAYHWWWRSYLTSGSSAFYFFVYATICFFTKLNITEFVPGMFYFGYMLVASYTLFVLAGTIGFYACLLFTRLIYSSVRIV